MRIDISKYQEHYHDKNKNKLVDNWQEGIRLLPFTSNPTSAVDKGSGLAGATGAFFRILEEEEVQAIENFQVTENVVRSYLIDKRKMNESQADEFILMLRDIMLVSGALNVTDVSFLKYIPLVPNDDMISDKNKKKYRSGQSKLANLLASMIDGDLIFESPENKNLFTRLLKEALLTNGNGLSSKKKIEEKYYILPFIAKSFNEDFKWMMEQDHSVAVRYIHLLLHFYVCFNLIQTLARLSHKERDVEKPFQFYFILNSEKASVNHDAVLQWRQIFPKTYLDKIFGSMGHRTKRLMGWRVVVGGTVWEIVG